MAVCPGGAHLPVVHQQQAHPRIQRPQRSLRASWADRRILCRQLDGWIEPTHGVDEQAPPRPALRVVNPAVRVISPKGLGFAPAHTRLLLRLWSRTGSLPALWPSTQQSEAACCLHALLPRAFDFHTFACLTIPRGWLLAVVVL